MNSATNAPRRLADEPVSVRAKLAALWTAVMLLYVYVDIFSFYKPGTVEDILDGRVWDFDITQQWALGALVLMSVPILMIALSVLLPAAAARWANIVVAAVYIIVSLGNLAGETWAYLFVGAVLEAALLVVVIRAAWTWPRA
ncbi:MAG: DUF6326 family protein [Gaiellales bacterium]